MILIKSFHAKYGQTDGRIKSNDPSQYFVCWGIMNSEHYTRWSGGAMVLGNFPVPGRPTIWIIVGQGPIALAVGAGGGCFYSPLSLLSSFSLSLGDGPI